MNRKLKSRWVQRRAPRACWNCKWFAPLGTAVVNERMQGMCRRYAPDPHMGWPNIGGHHVCGDHQY